jgi:DNA-directed RNA polymerase subunit RPC12/RpoP
LYGRMVLMGIILPAYMWTNKAFECEKCHKRFQKFTPAKVVKCPACMVRGIISKSYELNIDKKNLDPYSKQKERWYQDPLGRAHIDEIKHREYRTENGKKKIVIFDSKGRKIEDAVSVKPPEKKVEINYNPLTVSHVSEKL